MGFLDYSVRPRVMVVANGHSYDRTALMGMFESFEGMECFLVEHPIAEQVLNPDMTRGVDAIVLYDMPGGNPWTGPDYEVQPSDTFKAGFRALLVSGMPIVALHHAIAGWTAWQDYAEFLGGKLIFFPASVRGTPTMDSGIRMDANFTVTAEDAAHPIFAGLPSFFTLNDEAYLFEVFEDRVTPVARTDFPLTDRNTHSLTLAMTGERGSNRGWVRPPGSNIIAWTKKALNSSLAYIQPGHSAQTYADPHYRRLVRNAIDWAMRESTRP